MHRFCGINIPFMKSVAIFHNVIHNYIIALGRSEFLSLDTAPCAGCLALPPSQEEKYHCATDRIFTRS